MIERSIEPVMTSIIFRVFFAVDFSVAKLWSYKWYSDRWMTFESCLWFHINETQSHNNYWSPLRVTNETMDNVWGALKTFSTLLWRLDSRVWRLHSTSRLRSSYTMLLKLFNEIHNWLQNRSIDCFRNRIVKWSQIYVLKTDINSNFIYQTHNWCLFWVSISFGFQLNID